MTHSRVTILMPEALHAQCNADLSSLGPGWDKTFRVPLYDDRGVIKYRVANFEKMAFAHLDKLGDKFNHRQPDYTVRNDSLQSTVLANYPGSLIYRDADYQQILTANNLTLT